MSKEVTTKAKTEVSTEVADLSNWGAPVNLGQDMVLAKILPMQMSSKMVADDKAKFGEFRDSMTGERLGSIAEPIPLLPFHVQKFWDIQEADEQGKFKWVRTEPLIEDPISKDYNDNLPWQDKIEGRDVRRIRRMNFFVLRPSEIEEGSSIPMVLSFKSTSYKEGKKLLTQMYMRNRRIGLPPPGHIIILAGTKEKNDDGSWVVPNYELGPKATPAQMQEALNWFKIINKGGVKVDDSDLDEGASMMAEGNDTGTGNF